MSGEPDESSGSFVDAARRYQTRLALPGIDPPGCKKQPKSTLKTIQSKTKSFKLAYLWTWGAKGGQGTHRGIAKDAMFVLPFIPLPSLHT